jgi:hypothetical protein
MCTYGVAGRFRTYKGYELRQRPVPLLAYEANGRSANSTHSHTTILVEIDQECKKIISNKRNLVKLLVIFDQLILYAVRL